ncbi:MAG: hypothetical protein ACFFBP_15785 [Promethearchaeota archaeon]
MLDKNSFKPKALSDAEKIFQKVSMDQEQHQIFLDFIGILLKNLPLPELAAKGLGWRAVSIWQIKHKRSLRDLMESKPEDRIESIKEILNIFTEEAIKGLAKPEDAPILSKTVDEVLDFYKEKFAYR